MIRLKNYSCHNVLIFMRTVLTDKKFTNGNDYTHTKIKWMRKKKKICVSKITAQFLAR